MSSDLQQRAAELRGRLTAPNPEPWRPDQDEHERDIVGVFTRLEKGVTSYGDAWIVILTTPNGVERAVWLFHTALRNEFAKQRPAVGELVAIAYLGKKPTVDGRNEYDAYRVVVDRERAQHDWDAVQPVDQAEHPVHGALVSQPPVATAGSPGASTAVRPPGPSGSTVNATGVPCPSCHCQPGVLHAFNCPDDIPY